MKTREKIYIVYPDQDVIPTRDVLVYGADPEGLCVQGGDYVSAYDLMEYEGLEPSFYTDDGNIGTDGYTFVLELRPRPADSPEALYERICSMYQDAIERLEFDAVDLSSHHSPTGCHVHIGTVQGFSMDYDAPRKFKKNLGATCSYLVRLNGVNRGGGYGFAGDVRRQPWGVEYRTPPAIILARPDAFIWTCKRAMAAVLGEAPPMMSRAVRQAMAELRHIVRERIPYGMLAGGVFDFIDVDGYATDDGRRRRPRVHFADYWDRSVRRMVLRTLQSVRNDVSVTLFGYRSDRGNVCNIRYIAETVSFLEYYDDPDRGSYAIGLPRSFRGGRLSTEEEAEILTALAEYVQGL